jgi:5-methylcytosine-specific restriction endonuclease McrA
VAEVAEVMKRCSKCGAEKPAIIEYFYANKASSDGLQSQCKECRRETHAKRAFDFVSGARERGGGTVYKTCSMCGIEKLATTEFFPINNEASDGLFYWCKECFRDYNAKRRLDPVYKEMERNYQAERRLDPEYRERERDISKAYYKTERGKISKSASKQRYRAKKYSLPRFLTMDSWEKCLQYWQHKCAYCGSSDALEADHFIPLTSKKEPCPGTVIENIVPACKTCNSSKGNKSPYIWASKEALERIKEYFDSLTENELDEDMESQNGDELT